MSAPKDLVTPARTGGLRGPEVSRATITVTDLGDQDVETVLGVIHPSQVALVLAPDDVFRRVLGTDSLVFLSCVEVLSERSVVHIEDEDAPRLTTLSGSADFLVAARGEGRGPGDPVRPARPERRPAGPWLRRRRALELAVP
ncbi:2-oxo acid dehydrogenase subunit E2 [Streptomyces sp. NPDC012403]|uniref:2-oxo acid dehydrogenase subunit E2 n=1 Tax=Streptomyces sp. NPDC012403 TaxID=3364831 RepID=UPI0036F09EA0